VRRGSTRGARRRPARRRRAFNVALCATLIAGAAVQVSPAGLNPAGANFAEPKITPGVLVVESLRDDAPGNTGALTAPATSPSQAANLAATASSVAGPVAETAASGGIRLCFGSDTPAEVQVVATAAAKDWSDQLQLTGPTIEVDFYWLQFGSVRSLGAAGPGTMVQDDRLPDPDARYPVALANQLLNEDLAKRDQCDLAKDPEILLLLNSGAGGDGSLWNIQEGPPEANQIDLQSVIVHELGHGLGFIGSPEINNSGLAWPADGGAPYIFDRSVGLCGIESPKRCQRLMPLEVGNIGPLTGGALWFDLPGGVDAELYAPALWNRGSSFAHLDEARYADSLSLMTPFLDRGETQRQIDAAALAVLQKIGYSLHQAPAEFQSIEVIARNGEIVITPVVAALIEGVPPVAIDVEVVDSVGVVRRIMAPVGPLQIADLTNGVSYEIRVRGGNDGGTTMWRTVGPVTPMAVAPFVTGADFLAVVGPQVLGRNLTEAEGQVIVGRASVIGAGPSLAELFMSQRPQQQMMVARLYLGLLGRGPDPGGLAFWTGLIDAGITSERIARSFVRSVEFGAGSEPSHAALIDKVYLSVLGRAPDAGGLEFWRSQLEAGLDVGVFALAITESAEHRASADQRAAFDVVAFDLTGRTPTQQELSNWAEIQQTGALPAVINEILRAQFS